MRLRFTIRDLLWLTVVVAGGYGCSSTQQPIVDPLPPLADIESVEAEFFAAKDDKQQKFSVSQANWENVFEALKPAQVDARPANWQVLGELQINRHNNKPFHVFLFDIDTPGEPGAFAAGESWEERTYYRGGDSDKLKQALRKARSP